MTTELACSRIWPAASSGSRACRPSVRRRGLGLLHLAERAEEHVGEGAVHRLAHDDREDETARTVQRAGGDQELVVEHEAHRDRGETRVGVEDRDDRRHVGAADRHDQHPAEVEGQEDDTAEGVGRQPAFGLKIRRAPAHDGHAERDEVDDVLARVDPRPLRNPLDFLELRRGDDRAGEGEVAEDDLERRSPSS
jgi:hypothetical protein